MATVATSTAPIAYDERQCKLALAHLEKLQDQLDHLRPVIRNIIQPFRTKHANPQLSVNDSKQAAYSGLKDLSDFKSAWLDSKTQTILDYAKQSYLAQPDLRPGVNVPRYGWIKEVERDEASNGTLANGFRAENPPDEQQIEQIIERFKTKHPTFTVDHDASQHVINIRFKIAGLKARFRITQNKDLRKGPMFAVECIGTSTLCSAITRCIASRPQPNDLEHLLGMIASYKGARTRECAKCGNILDVLHGRAVTPAGRRLKLVTTDEGITTTTWQAYHENCL